MNVNDLKTAVILGMKENFETWNEYADEEYGLCIDEAEFNSNILLCETAEDVRNEVKSCFKENGCESWQASQFYAEVLEALVVTE